MDREIVTGLIAHSPRNQRAESVGRGIILRGKNEVQFTIRNVAVFDTACIPPAVRYRLVTDPITPSSSILHIHMPLAQPGRWKQQLLKLVLGVFVGIVLLKLVLDVAFVHIWKRH
jgi:hypothetical protein